MTIYITPDNKLYDDADGFALSLPSWPADAKPASQEQIDAINNPIKSIEENLSDCEAAIQSYLNSEAKAKNYDDIMSACSYAAAPNPFQDEAITFVTWRGDVWAYWYSEVDKIKANTRSMPTAESIIAELPLRKQVA